MVDSNQLPQKDNDDALESYLDQALGDARESESEPRQLTSRQHLSTFDP